MTGVQTCALPIWERESEVWMGEDSSEREEEKCDGAAEFLQFLRCQFLRRRELPGRQETQEERRGEEGEKATRKLLRGLDVFSFLGVCGLIIILGSLCANGWGCVLVLLVVWHRVSCTVPCWSLSGAGSWH